MAAKKAKRRTGDATAQKAQPSKRERVATDALPRETITAAEKVANILHRNYAGQDASWAQIAEGLELAPNNAKTKYLIWSAAAYGLIHKGENGNYSLAETGKKIVAPTYAGEDIEARRKAVKTPSVLSKFFSQYENHSVPEAQHFANILETRFTIPRSRTNEAIELIVQNGKAAKLLTETSDGFKVVGDDAAAAKATTLPEDESSAATGVAASSDWDKVCFVITPIGDDGSEVRRHADMFLHHVVAPAASKLGLRVVRADQIAKSGLITQQIFEHLAYSRFAVADLSFGNPNAFYELGVRHMFKKFTVQLVRKGDKIPFDVSQGRTITVDTSDVYTVTDRMASGARELTEHLEAALTEEAGTSNPVDAYFPGLKITLPPSDGKQATR